ncbi:MAG: hypothetical protein IT381_12455 [Deltaproteobacteria bacterium]|nr:hypothetical protein [Deltaproteobacteria bacterium]
MDCTLMRSELLAYYFGTSERAADAGAHLLTCKDCLGAYLRLKHEIERGAGPERPSVAMRERLRAEVADTFRPSLSRRLRAWLERPVPRYQSVALAAAAAFVLAVVVVKRGDPPTTASFAATGALTDSARASPESLDFY